MRLTEAATPRSKLPFTMSLPPGPRAPAAVQMWQWIARPIPFLERTRREYGDVFTVRFPVGTVVFLADPARDQAGLHRRPRHLPRRRGERDAARAADGPQLGAAARRARAHAPAQADAPLLPRRADAALRRRDARGRRAGDRDAGPWASRSGCARAPRRSRSRSSCARCSASTTPSGSRAWASGSASMLDIGMQSRALAAIALPQVRRTIGRGICKRFLRLRAAADAEIYDEIARRRQATDVEDRDDVLSILLQARDEDGRALTDEELRDELMTLLVAGHETTATSLAWAFELLLRDRPQLARLQAEVERGDGGRRVPRRRDQGDAAHPAGRAGRDPQADRADRAGRLRDPGRHARRAQHLSHPPPPGRLSGARALPPRALPRAARPRPIRGSRSAAACGAASAPRSRPTR